MITIKNVKTLDGQVKDYTTPSSQEHVIEANGKWLLLPALIDPHMSLGPISDSSQPWEQGISSAIRGGITTILEIPCSSMPCNTQASLKQKKEQIKKSLSDLQIPLHYELYGRADLNEIEELGRAKQWMKGLVLQLDLQKREELDEQWEKFFQMAAWENLPIIINARNENTSDEWKHIGGHPSLLEKAIDYAEKQNVRLYVLNVATQEEIDFIQEARKKSLLVYAETTPQHLFQADTEQADRLWNALDKGIIETIGSGFDATASGSERIFMGGGNYNFSDPAFLLPLLLTAREYGKISLEAIVRATRQNIHDIFRIEDSRDVVLVDLEKEESAQKITEHHTTHLQLKGWPMYTIVQGEVFSLPQMGYQ